jgi:hypothetical protein
MSFTNNKKPASQPAQSNNEASEKKKPDAFIIGSVKEGDQWTKGEIVCGLFLNTVTPREKIPEGLVKLGGTILNEATLPKGARLEIVLSKSLAAMGIKAVVNEDGDISVEPAE